MPVFDGINALSDAAYLSRRDPPIAYDGRYDDERPEASVSELSKFNKFVERKSKGTVLNAGLLSSTLDFAINKDELDDRNNFFTTFMGALSKIPEENPLSKKGNDLVIKILYDTLPHPVSNFEGPEHKFRSADGSGNNVLIPDLGKTGTRYARSVQAKHPQPLTSLPDPGLVFDTLLRARDWQPHPGGNSAMTFAYASIVTHSLFRTDLRDISRNNTSSYLDLSPVYGINQAEQDSVRNKEAGRGWLYPDAFAESRLFLFPPATSALLVLFSRNHNYIANMLLKINERKQWQDPPPKDDPEKLKKQDDEIFNTARLVNCGHFMSMIFGDYVSGFLGLPRDGNSWSMNPFDPIKKGEDILPRGEGNHCSVEFNVLYRWHATTSREDLTWTERVFGDVFGTNDFNSLTTDDFKKAAGTLISRIEPDPKKRPIGMGNYEFKRGSDGKFSDDDLAKIFQDATDSASATYRARGTNPVLRVIEIQGMEQARKWNVCTMNEFRKFLNLKPFKTFEEWNPDPKIADAARKLYNHIDNLELYPGLQAEQIIPLGTGSGICCGYTMTRAILADAICLVRGDRFYTTDFTPHNLTAWGWSDCQRNANNGAFGAHLPKLLFRHLPRHYEWNSVYGLFPFFTPEAMRKNLTKLGVAHKYNFDRPATRPIPKVLNTFTGIRHAFNDYNNFKVIYNYDMHRLTKDDYGFLLVFDEMQRHEKDKTELLHALFPSRESMQDYVKFYREKTQELIREKSFKYDGVDGTYVDIISQVVNLTGVHWAATRLCGIPLKTPSNPRGFLTEQEVYTILTVLFSAVFRNFDPEYGWVLREGGDKAAKVVMTFIERSISEVSPQANTSIIRRAIETAKSWIWPAQEKPCHQFLKKLAESGRSMDVLVSQVIGLCVGSSVNYAQSAAQVVDFYLDDARASERAKIIKLCAMEDPKSKELLRGYVREAMRLNPQFGGLFRDVVNDTVVPQGGDIPDMVLKKGDRIFASFRNAHLNPAEFPNPEYVDPRRPADSYQLQGCGFHDCPGVTFASETIPEIVRAIFSLPGIRRADNEPGKTHSFEVPAFETMNKLYVMPNGTIGPWPGPLFIRYDA